jgi:virulence factor Mce-like protein
MLVFAATCVGLLLFLWLSFGGSLPFAAQGYRIQAIFPYADELAQQSDVRISGVSVGDVVATQPAPGGGGVEATLQIDNPYAPIHADTRAILRTKTILGETYVELTPGTPNSPYLNDGATLPRGQVVPAVQLDQIFSTFNGPTRKAFMVWQEELAQALNGNGENLSDVIGNLPSFAANASDLLTVLDVQESAVEQLIRGGAITFAALDRDPAALTTLIKTGETTFAETAAQNKALSATFHDFPEFLKQSRLTLARLQTFASNTNPLISELEPVAQNLRPTLVSLRKVSPALEHFFVELKPLVQAAKTGLPATAKVLRGATPLLSALGPWLEQLNPIIDWLSIHQPLLSDFISNGAAALNATTTAFGGGSAGHYLRQYSPVGPETEALMIDPDPDNRGNTYPPAVWLNTPDDFKYGNFPSWDCYNTGAAGTGAEPADNTPEIGHESCWVAPTLPGAKPGKIPLLSPASYP